MIGHQERSAFSGDVISPEYPRLKKKDRNKLEKNQYIKKKYQFTYIC